MRFIYVLPMVALILLGGCRSKPVRAVGEPSKPRVATPVPATTLPPVAAVPTQPVPNTAVNPPPNLVSEQQRLASLFRGTPVIFSMRTDGNLWITVPARFCFERGEAQVKPALAAVLDQLAKGQREQASHIRIAAMPDSNSQPQPLAGDRAANTRKHLINQGMTSARITLVGIAKGAGIEMVVMDPPPR
jgi:outer membrane protein OmpA-like peptidoglycan-associated protein